MKTVYAYVIRHGQKNGDSLTRHGCTQVQASARTHLSGIVFKAAFCTDMARTAETIDIALAELGHPKCVRASDPRFGFNFAADPRHPLPTFSGSAANWRSQDPKHWLDIWPVSREIKGAFTTTLMHWAAFFAPLPGDRPESVNLLIGSHSPTGELAIIPLGLTGMLWHADILKYTLSVKLPGMANITAAEFLRCPID